MAETNVETLMRTVGVFRELWPDTVGGRWPSIFDSVEKHPLPDADRVLEYLDEGHVLYDMMDVSKDVFGGDETIVGGSSVLTDGTWLWRQDLQFYVRHHHVRLADEFLSTIRGNGYRVPAHTDDALRRYVDEAKILLFM